MTTTTLQALCTRIFTDLLDPDCMIPVIFPTKELYRI
ncbi:hypothetical protein V6Z11_D05G230100 [Gossypium hirsutum]